MGHQVLAQSSCSSYSLTKTDVLDFSTSGPSHRRQRLPGQSRPGDRHRLKRIGDAYLYLRGMQSTVGMKSVPADMAEFDELDEATPDVKALAKERLSHSDYRRLVELSNPSLPDYGIDEAFQESDPRVWMMKCPDCRNVTVLRDENLGSFPLQRVDPG